MTREEAIKTLKENLCGQCAYGSQCMESCDIRSCDNRDAIRALEQEPCDDAVSRQAAIDCLNANFTINGKENMETVVDYINGAFEQIKALPSVTPQQRVGQWMLSGGYWRCSECKEKVLLKLDKAKGNCKEYMPIKTKYCPNCGTKMKVSENG